MRRLTFIVALLLCVSLYAQRSLSLQDAVSYAQTGSFEFEHTEAEYMKGSWDFKHFESKLKPHLEFNLNPNYVREGYEEAKKNFIKLGNNDRFSTLAELRLNQRVTSLGGDFYASTSGLWSEYFRPYSGFDRLFGVSPIRVGYEQRLIGYNPYRWEKKIEDAKIDVVEKERNYKMWEIALKAADLYMNALRAEAMYEMYSSNSAISEILYKIGKEKYAITSMRNDEISALELQWMNSRTSCSLAKVEMENARRELYSYIGVPENEAPMLVLPPVPETFILDRETVCEHVKRNNPVYSDNMVKQLEARDKEDKAKKEKGVQASMDLNIGIQNYAPTLGAAYSTPSFLSVSGVTVKIPIIDQQTANSRYNAARYRTQAVEAESKETLRTVMLDVDCALRDFENYQMLIVSARKALELADAAYQQADENYANGIADINTFAIAQNRKEDAYSNYLNTICCYWDAYYRLSMLCGADIHDLR